MTFFHPQNRRLLALAVLAVGSLLGPVLAGVSLAACGDYLYFPGDFRGGMGHDAPPSGHDAPGELPVRHGCHGPNCHGSPLPAPAPIVHGRLVREWIVSTLETDPLLASPIRWVRELEQTLPDSPQGPGVFRPPKSA